MMTKAKSRTDIFSGFSIITDRLRIRPFEVSDLADLYAVISDDAVIRFLPEGRLNLNETREILEWVVDCYAKNRPGKIIKFTAAVEHSDRQRLIGWCGLGPLEFRPDEIEIFCGFASEFWGQGYATEAARAMLRYGFETIELDEIVAVVDRANTASRRLIERLEFTYRDTVTNLPDEYGFYEGFLFYSKKHADFRAR